VEALNQKGGRMKKMIPSDLSKILKEKRKKIDRIDRKDWPRYSSQRNYIIPDSRFELLIACLKHQPPAFHYVGLLVQTEVKMTTLGDRLF
jgi:hypothetical protein